MTEGEISNKAVFILAIVVLIVISGSVMFILEKLNDAETKTTNFGTYTKEGKMPITTAVVKIDVKPQAMTGGA